MSKLIHSAHKEKKRTREATITTTAISSSSSAKKKKTTAIGTEAEAEAEVDIDSLEKFEAELDIKPSNGEEIGKGRDKGRWGIWSSWNAIVVISL